MRRRYLGIDGPRDRDRRQPDPERQSQTDDHRDAERQPFPVQFPVHADPGS